MLKAKASAKAMRLGLIGLAILLLGTVLVPALSSPQLTGDEILQRVDDRQDEILGGNLISIIRFDNTYADGTTAYNLFGALGKRAEGQPDKSLIYFIEPEDVQGTIFLSIKPEGEDARMWLYLPALGKVKELIAEERQQSFAGSTFSYREVGERRISDDYTAELVGEEAVQIGEEAYECYLLKLKAKPEADVRYPTGKMWVGKESWLALKAEDYNEAGNLERTMVVLKLGEFEGKPVADEILAENVLEGNSTKISFLERRRPEKEIPDSVFDPESLPEFDPAEWGFVEVGG